MATYLITGSSRGLGLALVEALIARPESEVRKVFAAARPQNAAKLQELAAKSAERVMYVPLDVTIQESIATAFGQVQHQLEDNQGLDFLINNAGVNPSTVGGLQGMDGLIETLRVNVTSVHNVTRAFLPLLRKGRKNVMNIIMGSIGMAGIFTQNPPSHAYKVSKAALNMLTAQYALTYADEGFTIVAVSPGWLRTDMGGPEGDLDVETGADAVLKIVDRLSPSENGKFLNIHVEGWEEKYGMPYYNGQELMW